MKYDMPNIHSTLDQYLISYPTQYMLFLIYFDPVS